MTATDEQSLTYHLTCMRCHYRLRGLREDGACPECGTPIAQSIQWWGEKLKRVPWWRRRPKPPGPLLHAGDGRWLRQVALGAWTLAATWGAVAAWLGLRATSPWKSLAPDYMLLAVGAAYFVSAWLLAAPERRADVPARWDAARWVLRGTALGACAATWLALRAEQVPAHEFWRYSKGAMTLGGLCIPAAACLTFLYLGHLAARAPDRLTAAACRTVGYTIAAILASPCCLGATDVLRGAFAVTYREDHSQGTLGEALGEVLRMSDATGYFAYSFVLVLLLRLALVFSREVS
jgi:hypothetical protein